MDDVCVVVYCMFVVWIECGLDVDLFCFECGECVDW